MKKPALLQINTAGSWRNVVEFDAADDVATAQIKRAGVALAVYGAGSITLRVVERAGAHVSPTESWTPNAGWKPWRDRS